MEEPRNIPKMKTDRAENMRSDDRTGCEQAHSLAYLSLVLCLEIKNSKWTQSVGNKALLHRKLCACVTTGSTVDQS